MERLTQRDVDGDVYVLGVDQDFYDGLPFNEMCLMMNALDRLAAYEDIGMKPEEIAAKLKEYAESPPLPLEDLKRLTDVLDRLADLVEDMPATRSV